MEDFKITSELSWVQNGQTLNGLSDVRDINNSSADLGTVNASFKQLSDNDNELIRFVSAISEEIDIRAGNLNKYKVGDLLYFARILPDCSAPIDSNRMIYYPKVIDSSLATYIPGEEYVAPEFGATVSFDFDNVNSVNFTRLEYESSGRVNCMSFTPGTKFDKINLRQISNLFVDGEKYLISVEVVPRAIAFNWLDSTTSNSFSATSKVAFELRDGEYVNVVEAPIIFCGNGVYNAAWNEGTNVNGYMTPGAMVEGSSVSLLFNKVGAGSINASVSFISRGSPAVASENVIPAEIIIKVYSVYSAMIEGDE